MFQRSERLGIPFPPLSSPLARTLEFFSPISTFFYRLRSRAFYRATAPTHALNQQHELLRTCVSTQGQRSRLRHQSYLTPIGLQALPNSHTRRLVPSRLQ